MGKPEAENEDYLARRVKELGGETRKVTWVGRRGAPDRFVMLPGENTINFWAEMKRSRSGVTQLHQEREIKRMRAFGEVVYILDSKAEIDRVLALHMAGRTAT